MLAVTLPFGYLFLKFIQLLFVFSRFRIRGASSRAEISLAGLPGKADQTHRFTLQGNRAPPELVTEETEEPDNADKG